MPQWLSGLEECKISRHHNPLKMKNIILLSLFFCVFYGTLVSIGNAQTVNEDFISDTVFFLSCDQPPVVYGNLDKALKSAIKGFDKKTLLFFKDNTLHISLRVNSDGIIDVTSESSLGERLSVSLEQELQKLIWMPARHNGQQVGYKEVTLFRIEQGKPQLFVLSKREQIKENNASGGRNYAMKRIYEAHGVLNKCLITDAVTGLPLNKATLRINNEKFVYSSDPDGSMDFYCDSDDKITVSYLGYTPVSFHALENPELYRISLEPVLYQYEMLDLTKYHPKRLPVKADCPESDYKEKELKGVIVFLEDELISDNSGFNGGNGCMRNYIAKNFVLPENMLNEEGNIIEVFFKITEKGDVTEIYIHPESNELIKTEIISLFSTMPKWMPAIQNKMNVPQNLVLPLKVGESRYWKRYYQK